MDYRAQVFNVGVQAIVTGTATYSVQYTLDDVYAPPVGGLNWTDLPSPFSGATASQVGDLKTPCAGMRLNVTAGAGTVVLTLMQSSGQG
jgi:hypothetical protein